MKMSKRDIRNIILILTIIAVITPTYISQYKKTYKNPSERKELSVDIIFID